MMIIVFKHLIALTQMSRSFFYFLYHFISFHTVSIVLTIIEIKHKELLKKVRNYQRILESAKLRPQDFFIRFSCHWLTNE
mgnify:CR=1 FL=1